MSDRDEIKAKLDIVEVIREYIPVKSAGVNFQALCPFHNEKSPSFVISPDKQIWHCFGCSRGGDIFSFVMEKEGLNFIEALRLLAVKAGVTLRNESATDNSKRNRLLDIMELAGKYYAHILSSSTGQVAKEYLLKRGLTEETINDWQLGYSLDAWSSLYEFLLSRPKLGKKYTDEEIAAAGLTIRKEKNISNGRQYYDRFRDRIMFPIWDVNGSLVAFTARVNPTKEQTEKMGKYINSPQSEIYDKSRILFGLNKAKETIRKSDLAIVVEGQMDAISCYNHGFKNVVASSGTALTAEQVTLIKRFTNNIALAFDMDAAGQTAADRGIKEVLAQGMNIKIITLPHGKDPDDCLRQNPEDFRQAVENAQPMLEYYFQKTSAGLDLNKLENKILVRDKMFAMIALVPNKSDQGHWLKRVSEELDFAETDIREEFSRRPITKTPDYSTRAVSSGASPAPLAPPSRENLLSELLLALIIKFPELINYSLTSLDPEVISSEDNARFYKTLIIYYNKAATFSYEDFRLFLEQNAEDELGRLDRLLLLGEKEFYSHVPEQAREALIRIIVELKRYDCQTKIRRLEKALALLEKDGGENSANVVEMERLMAELKSVTEELKRLT